MTVGSYIFQTTHLKPKIRESSRSLNLEQCMSVFSSSLTTSMWYLHIFVSFRIIRAQGIQIMLYRTIWLVPLALLHPCTDLSWSIALRITKQFGLWRALFKPPQRQQGPDSRLWIASPDSFTLLTSAHSQIGWSQPTVTDFTRYFWLTIYITIYICTLHFITNPLWFAVGPQSI